MAYYDWLPATRGQLRKLEIKVNNQQTEIDGITERLTKAEASVTKTAAGITTIQTGVDGLQASVLSLKQEIADLKAANPALDLTALEAASNAVADDAAKLSNAADTVVADLNPPAPETPTV